MKAVFGVKGLASVYCDTTRKATISGNWNGRRLLLVLLIVDRSRVFIAWSELCSELSYPVINQPLDVLSGGLKDSYWFHISENAKEVCLSLRVFYRLIMQRLSTIGML
jgi:hypothetical protein